MLVCLEVDTKTNTSSSIVMKNDGSMYDGKVT